MSEGAAGIGLVDSTLVRGQHCVWDGRMTGAMLLPYLKRMDSFGFSAIDIMAPSVFTAAVEAHGECPFGRIRRAAERATETPLNVWTRGRFLFADHPVSDDILAEGIELVASAGATWLTTYDPLNDIDSLAATVAAGDAQGLHVNGALVYSPGVPEATAHYADLARDLRDLDVASVCLYDPGGLLEPAAARELVPALVDALGATPLTIATHCRSAQAEIVCLEAVAEGVQGLHVAAPPVAGGPSLPSAPHMARALHHEGQSCAVAPEMLEEMADYFSALGEAQGWPEAQHALADQEAKRHQMPLGTEAWLEALREDVPRATVFKEIALVRKALGEPAMSTPVARAVARQALVNIASSTRYDRCDESFAALVQGDWGMLPGPVDIALRKGMKSEGARPAETKVVEVGSAAAERRVIAACLGPDAARRLDDLAELEVRDIESPRDLLDAELAAHPSLRHLRLKMPGFAYDWTTTP